MGVRFPPEPPHNFGDSVAKKKFSPEKRDWKKYPTIYDFKTGEFKPESVLISVKNVVHGFGYPENISDLEKLHIICDLVYGYERDTIEAHKKFSIALRKRK